MDDLFLYRLLGDAALDPGAMDPSALVPRLEALARRPPLARAPWLGRVAAILRAPDPAIREAALGCLEDATGPLAIRALVAALDDGEARVRRRAVTLLRRLAATQPMRWAHVVFHPREDVRAAAASEEPPPGATELAMHLLADASLVEAVRALKLRAPARSLDVILHLRHAGRISNGDARHLVAHMATSDLIAWADAAPPRPDDAASRILASEGQELEGGDRLDRVFAIWDPRDDDDEGLRARFFRGLGVSLRAAADTLRVRVAASLTVCAAGWGGFGDEALGVMASHYPFALGWTSVPRPARERAVDAILRYQPNRPISGAVLRRILDADLARRPNGALDLRLCAALLWFIRADRYAWLVHELTLDAIVDAFLRDPEHAAPFLTVPDPSKEGRRWMVEQILERAGARAPFVIAVSAAVSRNTELDVLREASIGDRMAVLGHLLEIEHRPGVGFAEDQAKLLAAVLGDSVSGGHELELVARWLEHREHERTELGRQLLRAIAKRLDTGALAGILASLPTRPLRRLLAILEDHPLLTYGQERALALRLASHVSPAVAAWAEQRTPTRAPPERTGFAPSTEVSPLPAALREQIRTVPDLEAGTIARCHGSPSTGLVAALEGRAYAPTPSVPVAVALLGCHDAPEDVARAFERWIDQRPAFLSTLDEAMVTAWGGNRHLPLLGDAWMWRFEAHGLKAAEAMADGEGGIAAILARTLALPSPILVEQVWSTAARGLTVWRYREPERLREMARRGHVEPLLDRCIEQLDTELGLRAAQMIASLYASRVAPEEVDASRGRVVARLPDLSSDVRAALRDFVDSRGLPTRDRGAREGKGHAEEGELERIARETRLDVLTNHCQSIIERVVHEATLRLCTLGAAGCARLVALVTAEPPPAHFAAIAASVSLWEDAEALHALRLFLAAGRGFPELRFRLALGLLEGGDAAMSEVALDAALAPASDAWLGRRDVERLFELVSDRDELARQLATADHPHAYMVSIAHLLSLEVASDEDLAALVAFLQAGDTRIAALREDVARALHVAGDSVGLPILVAWSLGADAVDVADPLLTLAEPELVDATVEGILHAGSAGAEAKLLRWLDHTNPAVREPALERLLAEASEVTTRSAAIARLPKRPRRASKLRKLAETFAWGLNASRELTGRVLRPHMISGAGLGFTRLNEDRIFITPLPLLREERNGVEIVEGLILHEIGHHRHHRGPTEARVWSKADQAGLGKLLNLVADEHLERNLRAFDKAYGDKLKRLDAYAFQHAEREIAVWHLLDALGGRAFDVLVTCRLGAGRTPHSVHVETGQVLAELERAGSSFSRFMRALRMGLGNRHADPLVDAGLALFTKSFRKNDMAGLWEITKELHRIFGDEVVVLSAFGGSESLEEDAHEDATHGEGIGDHELQGEVERIMGPPDKSAQGGRGKKGRPRPAINVSPDESFDEIHEVTKIAADPVSHRAAARDVARHARRLRATFSQLGLALEPQRMRLRGRRFDTTRVLPLVTRGDPRILVARELRQKTDLHLGLVVDCSGSMQGASMERAHRFGVLLTEATRGLRGVDVSIIGFTDREIFDAGDARRPAVTSLRPNGGNNDAAGLWYAAQDAMRSPRRAKVLVMISDGLPTECSVAALRALVRRLTRRHGLVCAQVAVRPLAEIAFPHYVEIDEEQLDQAVGRFGRIIASLVGRTLSA